MTGFDLTQIGKWPNQGNKTQTPSVPQQTTPPPPAAYQDPNAPKTLEEALTKPTDPGELKDESGTTWKDRRPPDYKRDHWSIDKFAEGNRIVQGRDKDGNPIYIDGKGNLPVDPKTGKILTVAPPSTAEDKKEINYDDKVPRK